MIGRFWDVLFDYADKARDEGDEIRYAICHEIEDLLQDVYDTSLKHSSVIKNRTPQSKCEELVLSIPDIVVYKDPDDGEVWYDLLVKGRDFEHKRFDYPEEVLSYIIKSRTRDMCESMNTEKQVLLQYISERITRLNSIQDALIGNRKMINRRKPNAKRVKNAE
jgi:hypothetical protein